MRLSKHQALELIHQDSVQIHSDSISHNPCVDIDGDQVTVDVPFLTPFRLREFRQALCNATHFWAARRWRHGVGSSDCLTSAVAVEPK